MTRMRRHGRRGWWLVKTLARAALYGLAIGAVIMILIGALCGCGPGRTIEDVQTTAAYIWLAQPRIEIVADAQAQTDPSGAEALRRCSRQLAKRLIQMKRAALRRRLIRDAYAKTSGELLDMAESTVRPYPEPLLPEQPTSRPSGPDDNDPQESIAEKESDNENDD